MTRKTQKPKTHFKMNSQVHEILILKRKFGDMKREKIDLKTPTSLHCLLDFSLKNIDVLYIYNGFGGAAVI